jgi:hypothetical protein
MPEDRYNSLVGYPSYDDYDMYDRDYDDRYYGGKRGVKRNHRGGAFSAAPTAGMECRDLAFMEDQVIDSYVAMDNDNIVFKMPGTDSYLCVSRSDLATRAQDPSNLVMACTSATKAINITPDMFCGLKLSNIKTLAIGYGGFASYKNLVEVVINSTDSVFEIEEYDAPITLNAIVGLLLMPEHSPQLPQVPFYQDEEENMDDYVRKLNEWGSENGQPELGERFEEAWNLVLGAGHCQSGYEGSKLYRIVSKSVPDYQENPRVLKGMFDNGCIEASELPPVGPDTPSVNWTNEFFYMDATDYPVARNLFGNFAGLGLEDDEDNSDDGNSSDTDNQLTGFLLDQFTQRGGVLQLLHDFSPEGTSVTAGSLIANNEVFVNGLKTLVQANPYRPTYCLALASHSQQDPSTLVLRYLTNIDGAYARKVDGMNAYVTSIDEGQWERASEIGISIMEEFDELVENTSDYVSDMYSSVQPKIGVVVGGHIDDEETIHLAVVNGIEMHSKFFTNVSQTDAQLTLDYHNKVLKRVTNLGEEGLDTSIPIEMLSIMAIRESSGEISYAVMSNEWASQNISGTTEIIDAMVDLIAVPPS